MATALSPIELLPNELLDSILTSFPTPFLLSLASISHRFHRLVARLVYRRFRRVVSLPRYELILECFPPSEKLTAPTLHCDYLGTAGLDDGGGDGDGRPQTPALSDLLHMYSRFRPVLEEDPPIRRPRRRRLPATELASDLTPIDNATTTENVPPPPPPPPSPPSHDISLDEGELFMQLCAMTNLVKTGPRRGIFLSCVSLHDSVLRVWRDWLARRSKVGSSAENDDDGILWTDKNRTVGIRFGVVETTIEQPLLTLAHEDPAVSYRLEYRELLVKTCQLQLTKEQSEVQEASPSGKAVVIMALP